MFVNMVVADNRDAFWLANRSEGANCSTSPLGVVSSRGVAITLR